MLKQTSLTQRWKWPGGPAVAQIAALICAGLLAGCATSLEQGGGSNIPVRDFQSSTDVRYPKSDVQSAKADVLPKVEAQSKTNIQSNADSASANASAPESPPPLTPPGGAQTSSAGSAGYLIGSLDVLDISVFKVPELSKSVQVADTGTINLPLLGDVLVAGKTANEIEKELTRQLGAKYLKSPQVSVYVKEHNSQRVTVEGAVKKPGVYPIKGTLTLLQLLATAEGVDKEVYSKDVTVFRTVDGERTSKIFDIDQIRTGKAEDPSLRQGDLVVVDTSAGKEAFQNTLKIVPAVGALRPTVW